MSNPTSELNIPADPHERAAWVVFQLRLRGVSFAAIARRHGWSRRVVAMAMRVPSFPQEKAIAEELGLPVERLFPERYDGNGKRRHLVRGSQDSDGTTDDNVKSQEAA